VARAGKPGSALILGSAIAALVIVCGACAWVAGPAVRVGATWTHAGETWARIFVVALGLAFGAYVCGLALLRCRPAGLRSVAAIAVVIQLGLLGAPLLVSTDAWSYWDYARIAAVHDANPYAVPPSAFPHDPAYPHMPPVWHHTTSVYGPAFTLASEPIAALAGSSPERAAWSFKALGAAAVLAATALAGFLARRRVYAVAFVGWNPILAVDFAGSGHNDAWTAALVLAALALAATGRRRLAAVAWTVASFVKWVPLLLLPLHLLEQRARGRSVRYLTLGASLATGAAIASIAFGPDWLRAVTPLAHLANVGSHLAIPSRLAFGLPQRLVLTVSAAALIIGYVWLVRSALHGRARLGLAAGLLLVVSPYLVSWYTVWAVPLAAAEEDGAAQLLSLGLCAYLLRQGIRT
jgi:hypothetical protein